MDQDQHVTPAPSKSPLAVGAIAAAVAALMSGGGVYAYEHGRNTSDQSKLQTQIDGLRSQLATVATPTPVVTSTPTPSASATPAASPLLTADQIYAEVSAKLSLVRSQVTYFRVFGQDRVQYGYNAGANFAYKDSIGWHLAYGPAQSVPECSSLTSVPAKYLPVCTDSAGKLLYADSSSQSVNYPQSEAVSYIGQ